MVLDQGSFDERSLQKAGLAADPRQDGTLDGYRVVAVDISANTKAATRHTGLSSRDQLRCKNFYALGLVYWMFERDRAPTVRWLEQRFKDRPDLAAANIAALDAGHALGETAELHQLPAFHVERAPAAPGLYRTITGHEALAFGLLDGARKAGLKMVFCSYPITPASALLHHLAKLRGLGVTTFQAEDEIAAACAAIGASYAGSLGVTASSGPGIALKTEAIGLAVATELPLVIVNAQRGGPSTGLPTKTEQSDLYQAVMGRNGDTPIVVLAAATPVRLLRHGARGRAHRRPPHDPGHAAHRRLPRQLVRALADPRRRRRPPPSPPASAPIRRASTPSCATSGWSAPGSSPARPASSTASAASRRTTTAATSPTTRPTTSA